MFRFIKYIFIYALLIVLSFGVVGIVKWNSSSFDNPMYSPTPEFFFMNFMGEILLTFFLLSACYNIIRLIFNLNKPKYSISRWSHLFEGLSEDPLQYYQSVKNILDEKKVPDVQTRTRQFRQGGWFSPYRTYFQVLRKEQLFHICAAQWGEDYFFSWWVRPRLIVLDWIIMVIPVIGPAIVRWRHDRTYFQEDTYTMFRGSVHTCVMRAIDELTDAKGLKSLTELERLPDKRSDVRWFD